MTLDEIAYNLLNLIRGGRSHNDENISLDQIKFNIKHYRAMFIRRDYTKNGFVSRHVEQDLGCIFLEPVDASQCCSLPSTCIVYKSKRAIPKTIRYNFEEAISYVGDITGTNTIPMINSNAIQWLPYDKYTKHKMKAYMIGNYIYVYNAEGLEAINLRGVFEDPKDVAAFDLCDGYTTKDGTLVQNPQCYEDSITDYPIPMDMLALINQGILAGELTLLASTMSDIQNDRMQDPGSHISPQQTPKQ
tara:strand:+ start:675 stop:1412 length:738 start_codon:yes stop_codon:yes gene_type:complete